MCDSYARSLLRVSVAQICQALGWDAVQLTACDLLSDVLDRYIQQLARGCHRYSELYGRTDPVLDDVGQAFRLLGVSLSELEDYVHNLEPVGFAHQTPLFPVKEEEERVLTDMGTSAEAMQVPLDEEEEDLGEEDAVSDENHPLKRPMLSPDASMGMMASKRPRLQSGFSPEWAGEPKEPLSSLNPQHVPSSMMDSMGSLASSPETALPNTGFRPLPMIPRHSDHKASCAQHRKPNVSSPGRQRARSPKGAGVGPSAGSPLSSPKAFSKEKRKSPGQAKSPKSPKSSKSGTEKAAHTPEKGEPLQRTTLATLSERMGKENVHVRQQNWELDRQPGEAQIRNPEPNPEPDNTIDDSIDAVIARACADREPDPFSYTSASDSESDSISSPRRLTIMEPATPKTKTGTNVCYERDTSTPLSMSGVPGSMWTMDDSINEVIRRANQGASGARLNDSYLSSPSASPPTPEPLMKVFEDKHKMVASTDVKKRLKKELKNKLKKKEKEKPKEKDKERDKGKMKDKNRDKNKGKTKEFLKEAKIPWKDFSLREDDLREHFKMRDLVSPEMSLKSKLKDGTGSSFRKDKERHMDKKKDKEKIKKDKDTRDKGKDRGREDKKLSAALTPFGQVDVPMSLFSPSSCLRIPSMLPPLPPILSDRDSKGKEKDKKKDKKEKKKKREKERERAKEKEREKEGKKKEKEREKEKREKEKEKEKNRLKLEKVKVVPPAAVPSPVIPRLTLRVGGQDKIVISKVAPNSDIPKVPMAKAPSVKATQPLAPIFSPAAPLLAPAPPLAVAAGPAAAVAPPSSALSQGGSLKTPVCSVVTETVSAYVIRDEWGNKIWICPGCNKPDDGSPMIGCDDCDDWYHWPCVGIMAAPPEDVQWFCVKCAGKKKDKKHKKRKHKVH
ncbi:transcription initiation factor TFIID subunit 3-like isoform X2 [Sardina pilchardus]|uniref:transcription initiation factor TFIID subunit 3-like isoform X2 n=1 Tax=Sardina pilchardus TaxID=27697 RepID=UPI002E148481